MAKKVRVEKAEVVEAPAKEVPRLAKYYNYVTFQEGGKIDRLYCKACGTEIAGTIERPRAAGGLGANQFIEKYMRFPTYAEAKFAISHRTIPIGATEEVRVMGGFHITHGCKDCLRMDMDLELAQQMYLADMESLGQGPTQEEKVEAVVALDHTGSGMV